MLPSEKQVAKYRKSEEYQELAVFVAGVAQAFEAACKKIRPDRAFSNLRDLAHQQGLSRRTRWLEAALVESLGRERAQGLVEGGKSRDS